MESSCRKIRSGRISQAEAQAWFIYYPGTGALHWRASPGPGTSPFSPAGTIYKNGRRYIILKGKRMMATHIIWVFMTGVWPALQVDHENRKRDDNRWCNLRSATKKQNGQNRTKNRDKLLPKGVSKHASRYRARIRVDGELKSLGSFDTPAQAAAAYLAAARAAWGAFACGG